jgi:nicotinamide mononucleotide (NMN) deamidase PncC
MWSDKLKEAGVSIHVIATGGGAGLQQQLWEVPGSSAYLSGASFPYSNEEQEELLGFMPEHFCSEEAAIDLASAAYMKAFTFGGKKPVGISITASVASEKEHRGEHRVYCCIITDDKVRLCKYVLEKGVGKHKRHLDGGTCDDVGFFTLIDTLGLNQSQFVAPTYVDATEKARERFMLRPVFTMDGKRKSSLDGITKFGIMPGAYNPPHVGHFGVADSFMVETGMRPVFEIAAKTPHKAPLAVQDMLKRAKMLRGRDVIFTSDIPLFIEKARTYPGAPLIMGADAAVRLFDPKWGIKPKALLKEFKSLGTKLYIAERKVEDKYLCFEDIIDDYLPQNLSDEEFEWVYDLFKDVPGKWDISSTELRNKVK